MHERQTIFVSENDLFLVLLNLITNSALAMSKSKEKKISLSLKSSSRDGKSFHLLVVSDTGCGIPQELRVKIFQANFTTGNTGNGLGLSIVKSTMENMGGFIEVESEENIATNFHLYFPVC